MADTRTVKLIAKLQDNMTGGLKNINVNSAALAAAMVALSAAVLAATKKLADYGAKIYDLSSATGVSVEGVQSLGYAFEQTGGSIDSMSGAIRGLNTFMRTAATGGAEYQKVLDDLGIRYEDLRSMSPEDAFITLTDAIGGLNTEMDRNIAATTVFGGRYAQQIVGALDQAGGSLRNLTEQFDETGNALSVDQIEAMKKYSDSMKDVEYATKAFAADALVPLMPRLIELIDKATELGTDVAPGVGVALSGLLDVIVLLTDAFTYVKDATVSFNDSLGSTGDIAGWVINPIGSATASILEFFDAAAKADAALREWDDAANTASATASAATLIQSLYSDAMTGTADQAAFLIHHLELLEAQGANVGEALDNLRGRHESLTNAQLLAQLETMTLEENMGALTGAQIQTAQSAIDLAVAELRLRETMAVGPTVIAAQIAELLRYRDTLDSLSQASGGVGAYGPSESDVENGIKNREAITEAMKAAAVEEFNAAASNEERLARIQSERIARIKDQEFAALQVLREQQAQAEAEREAAAGRAYAITERFSTSFVNAAGQGKEAWGDFWNDFANQIQSIVMSKAFASLLNFVSGGLFGGALSFLGFAGGTPSVPQSGPGPYKAAAGMIVPGSLGSQRDGVPMMAMPGEAVISRQGVEDMRQSGGSVYNVSLSFPSTIGTMSRSQMAQAVPVLKELIQKGGL